MKKHPLFQHDWVHYSRMFVNYIDPAHLVQRKNVKWQQTKRVFKRMKGTEKQMIASLLTISSSAIGYDPEITYTIIPMRTIRCLKN
jgi:hypothetical protein